MPNLTTSILRSVPLSYPPLHDQELIETVLGSLDDKIELNRKLYPEIAGSSASSRR